jgi:hypothetical protein
MTLDFFASRALDIDGVEAKLDGLPITTADAKACSLQLIVKAGCELTLEGIAEGVAPLVLLAVKNFLNRVEEGAHNAAASFREATKRVTAKQMLKALDPMVLDLLEGNRDEAEATVEQLVFAVRCWTYWDHNLVPSPAHGSRLAAAAGKRNATEPAPAKKDPAKGLDRAAQQGREAWKIDAEPVSPYVKKEYTKSFLNGWDDCQRAYERGRCLESYPDVNPYADCDEAGAMAAAFDAGWESTKALDQIVKDLTDAAPAPPTTQDDLPEALGSEGADY